jgi:hypothetical protein
VIKVRCSICNEFALVVDHEFKEGLTHQPTRIRRYIATLYFHPVTHEPYCSPTCATASLTYSPADRSLYLDRVPRPLPSAPPLPAPSIAAPPPT